jgi:hypothetical protein
MVDRISRDRAFQALKRFVDRRATNDEFELEYAEASPTEDRAIQAIDTMVWHFFSDSRVHRLTGQDEPTPEGRALLQRCLDFLRTDHEYEWPDSNFTLTRRVDALSNVLTVGHAGRRAEVRYQEFRRRLDAAGDFNAWPFMSLGQRETSVDDADRG